MKAWCVDVVKVAVRSLPPMAIGVLLGYLLFGLR